MATESKAKTMKNCYSSSLLAFTLTLLFILIGSARRKEQRRLLMLLKEKKATLHIRENVPISCLRPLMCPMSHSPCYPTKTLENPMVQSPIHYVTVSLLGG